MSLMLADYMSKKRWSFDRRAFIYQDGQNGDKYIIKEGDTVRLVNRDELPDYIAGFIREGDRISIKLKRYSRRVNP